MAQGDDLLAAVQAVSDDVAAEANTLQTVADNVTALGTDADTIIADLQSAGGSSPQVAQAIIALQNLKGNIDTAAASATSSASNVAAIDAKIKAALPPSP